MLNCRAYVLLWAGECGGVLRQPKRGQLVNQGDQWAVGKGGRAADGSGIARQLSSQKMGSGAMLARGKSGTVKQWPPRAGRERGSEGTRS
jgi:hypothetical protein